MLNHAGGGSAVTFNTLSVSGLSSEDEVRAVQLLHSSLGATVGRGSIALQDWRSKLLPLMEQAMRPRLLSASSVAGSSVMNPSMSVAAGAAMELSASPVSER